MNHKITNLIFGLLLISQIGHSQDKNGYTIKGEVTGLIDGQWAYLYKPSHGERSWQIIDSGVVKNGKFTMHGYIPNGIEWLPLSLGKKRGMASSHGLLLDNANIQVRGFMNGDNGLWSKNPWDKFITIEGCKAESDRALILKVCGKELSNFNTMIWKLGYTTFFDDLNDSLGYNAHVMDSIEGSKLADGERLLKLMRDLKDNHAIPYIVQSYELFKYINAEADFKYIYKQLDDYMRNTEYGKVMKREVDSLCIGCYAPNFESFTMEHSQVSLKEIAAKNKVTLVSFWGCKYNFMPRANEIIPENRKLFPMYKKMHNKGFEIIGVSRQVDEKSWRKRIEMDGFDWYEVSNVVMNDPIFSNFELNTIDNTCNVLVDSSGKIIAWNVSNMLDLKWYLDKYLEK